jgi:hypothetical protein
MSNLLSHHLLFIFGALTFLCTYSWFKYSEIERFRSNIKSNTGLDGSSFSLFLVFLSELIICSVGVIGMGILFTALYDFAPEITSFLTSDPNFESPVTDVPDYYL